MALRTDMRGPGLLTLFTDLLTGWVCAPGRRTITAMIAVADPAGTPGIGTLLVDGSMTRSAVAPCLSPSWTPRNHWPGSSKRNVDL